MTFGYHAILQLATPLLAGERSDRACAIRVRGAGSMTVCDPLTRNVRAQRAHSDLSPAGRGKTASASTSADPALIAGQQLQLFGTIGRCVQKAFVGSHCCGGPAFRISVKAAIRIPKSYPGALRFNQCVFSLGPQLREQPLVILIQPGILTSCFSKHAIDHLRRNPIRLGNAGGICLRHFSVGRSNRSTAQKNRQADHDDCPCPQSPIPDSFAARHRDHLTEALSPRANTHVAPTPPPTSGPPTMTMLPSPDSATEDTAMAPVPASRSSCVQ